ncbi:hypothetical protein BCON_0229g00110 [Botryotinia convoluta]|uniref:Uncharacterized protein n=1 Tax=Botryotinia convoluta TaxID=54673 RepID=A0A4Z1HIC1_9HELO|nr:hypothetical protein BCON_0229g00110 [Botryotinia convoluta]
MSTEVSRPPRWCDSEKAYLTSITMHTVNGREMRIDPRSAIRQMTIEQEKHHLGGVAFAQDPWPIRKYAIHSMRQQWRRIKIAREEADRLGVEKPAQELQPQIERFIVPSGDSIASNDFNIEMPAEWQQEVEEMMAPLKQKWAEEDRAKASQYQSAVTAADQVLGADFWIQCQEDVDME